MYTVELSENILTVTARDMQFDKTITTYWKYDIVNWKRTVTGKKEENPTYPMSNSEIAWVTKHYLPKAKA